MTAVVLALCGVQFVVIVYIARRVWWVQRSVNTTRSQIRASAEHLDHVYTQLESLQYLHDVLDLRGLLPPLRGYASSPDFLRTVADHVRAHRPTIAFECSSGASTLVIARAMQMNGSGHLVSLEHLPEYRESSMRLLERAGLSDWATVVLAPLRPYDTALGELEWYDLADFDPPGPGDLLVIDGPPAAAHRFVRYPAGPELFPRLTADAHVLLDDADRPGEKQIVEQWLSEGLAASVSFPPAEKGCAHVRLGRP